MQQGQQIDAGKALREQGYIEQQISQIHLTNARLMELTQLLQRHVCRLSGESFPNEAPRPIGGGSAPQPVESVFQRLREVGGALDHSVDQLQHTIQALTSW